MKFLLTGQNVDLLREGTDVRIHRYPKVLSLEVISVIQSRLLEVKYDDVMDPNLVLRPLDFGKGHFQETCLPLCLHAKICVIRKNYVVCVSYSSNAHFLADFSLLIVLNYQCESPILFFTESIILHSVKEQMISRNIA